MIRVMDCLRLVDKLVDEYYFINKPDGVSVAMENIIAGRSPDEANRRAIVAYKDFKTAESAPDLL